MKIARFVLKWVALGLCVAAAVCTIIAYWDKILNVFHTLADKFTKKRNGCCASEYEDYVDYENWAGESADEA